MCVSLKPQIFIVKYFMFFTCSVPNMEKVRNLDYKDTILNSNLYFLKY